MNKLTLLPLVVVALSACGGEEATFSYSDSVVPADLSYSYPADGQQQVAPRAPFVARFSDPLAVVDGTSLSPVDLDAALQAVRDTIGNQVVWVRASDDAAVSFTVDLVDSDPDENIYRFDTFLLNTTQALQPATEYRVDLTAVETVKDQTRINGGDIVFTTRGEVNGPRVQQETEAAFTITRMMPDGVELPLVDFSTLRLQFSHPLDASSVQYGSSIALRDDTDTLVSANVLVSGARLTLDPVDDLQPGMEYELEIDNTAIRNLHGDVLAGAPGEHNHVFVPADTTPRSVLVQRADPSNADVLSQCDDAAPDAVLSPLTGSGINCVPIKAVLLGDDTSSQTTGHVYAELAYIPNFEQATPLRIPRGSLLTGASVDVNVAGEVPMWIDTDNDGQTDTPLSTGDIGVTFVSDASGYMIDNPYTLQSDQPRHVRLWLDVAMTADTAAANGALSQDLLHVEVVGTAIVRDGRLVLDAVAVVEPRVLGLEDAFGLLSFHMESYEDPKQAPLPVADTAPPTLQSWLPGDAVDVLRPGDSLILNFNEPIDPLSLEQSGAVALLRNDVPVNVDWRVDGSSLVLQPENALEFSAPGADVTYRIQAGSLVTDLAGNGLDQDYDLAFTMPVDAGGPQRAPLALTTYPGYPCTTSPTPTQLNNRQHGRCLGGKSGDDMLPVMALPENRPIRVQFSRNMDADSIQLGNSFRVERDNGGVWEPVSGRLEVEPAALAFWPDQPWQDDGNQLYRYVLGSQGGDGSAAVNCNGSSICDNDGLPLQTQVLSDHPDDATPPTEGGPDLVIYFTGKPAVQSVFQILRNLPSFDINTNMVLDAEEPTPDEDPDNAGVYPTPANGTKLEKRGVGGLLLDVNLGCGFVGRDVDEVWIGANPPPQECDDKPFIYLTGALNADVVGWNEAENGIEVHIYPTLLLTSSLDTYAVLSLVVAKEVKVIPTGPQVMRIRYENDGSGRRAPVTGYIRQDPSQGAVLDISLDLYLDAPYLRPDVFGAGLAHSLYSSPLTLDLTGPVTLLPDGRMVIKQLNPVASTDIEVVIGVLLATMTLGIPAEGVNLQYTAPPLKQ